MPVLIWKETQIEHIMFFNVGTFNITKTLHIFSLAGSLHIHCIYSTRTCIIQTLQCTVNTVNCRDTLYPLPCHAIFMWPRLCSASFSTPCAGLWGVAQMPGDLAPTLNMARALYTICSHSPTQVASAIFSLHPII